MSITKLIHRSPHAEAAAQTPVELAALADAAHAAAERSCAAIDDSLDFIAKSDARIARMERG